MIGITILHVLSGMIIFVMIVAMAIGTVQAYQEDDDFRASIFTAGDIILAIALAGGILGLLHI